MAASRLIIIEIFERGIPAHQRLEAGSEAAQLLAKQDALWSVARFASVPADTHDKPFQWS